MSKILQNAIKIKFNGQFLISHHVHDYQDVEVDGKRYINDGGDQYIRRGGDFINDPSIVEDYTITDDMSVEEMSRKFLWGTRGKDGQQPLKYELMRRFEKAHLEAILNNCQPLHPAREATIKHLIYCKSCSGSDDSDLWEITGEQKRAIDEKREKQEACTEAIGNFVKDPNWQQKLGL